MPELDRKLEELRLSLREIYTEHSEEEITFVWSQLLQILEAYRDNAISNEADLDSIWDSSSVVLITYPDAIYRKGESTLKTLNDFVNRKLGDLSSIIHILPFLPSTSDGGFAVSSHEEIDDLFGEWDDLKVLSVKHKVMADLVEKHPRRSARESAMQALYALEISNGYPKDVFDLYCQSFHNSEDKSYMENLFYCVIENKNTADQLISDCLVNWEYGRVALIDKILLRMGVSEIYYIDDVPPKVSISEMVEIAKIFSTEDSSSFVNGILDTVYKNYESKN